MQKSISCPAQCILYTKLLYTVVENKIIYEDERDCECDIEDEVQCSSVQWGSSLPCLHCTALKCTSLNTTELNVTTLHSTALISTALNITALNTTTLN